MALKSMLQWVAASEAGLAVLRLHPFGDPRAAGLAAAAAAVSEQVRCTRRERQRGAGSASLTVSLTVSLSLSLSLSAAAHRGRAVAGAARVRRSARLAASDAARGALRVAAAART